MNDYVCDRCSNGRCGDCKITVLVGQDNPDDLNKVSTICECRARNHGAPRPWQEANPD